MLSFDLFFNLAMYSKDVKRFIKKYNDIRYSSNTLASKVIDLLPQNEIDFNHYISNYYDDLVQNNHVFYENFDDSRIQYKIDIICNWINDWNIFFKIKYLPMKLEIIYSSMTLASIQYSLENENIPKLTLSISINSLFSWNSGQLLQLISHEYGHLLEHLLFKNANDDLKIQVIETFLDWYNDNDKFYQYNQTISKNNNSQVESWVDRIIKTDLPFAVLEHLREFNNEKDQFSYYYHWGFIECFREWWADQVSRFLTYLSLNSSDELYNFLLQDLHKIHAFLTNKANEQTRNFEFSYSFLKKIDVDLRFLCESSISELLLEHQSDRQKIIQWIKRHRTYWNNELYQWDLYNYKAELMTDFQILNLTSLMFGSQNLSQLPDYFQELNHLKGLTLGQNNFSEIPKEIQSLTQLNYLNMRQNQIKDFPEWIGLLSQLKTLVLGGNKIQYISLELLELTHLTELYLWRNQLKEFDLLCSLENLTMLDVSSNQIEIIPAEIHNLKKLKELRLNDNKINDLPKELFELETLKILNLSNNQLTHLPIEFQRLNHLEKLFIGNNPLFEFPDVITLLNNLKEIHMNEINCDELPSEIKNLIYLDKLDISNNLIEELPKSLLSMRFLTELNITGLNLNSSINQVNLLRKLSYENKLNIIGLSNSLKTEIDKLNARFIKSFL